MHSCYIANRTTPRCALCGLAVASGCTKGVFLRLSARSACVCVVHVYGGWQGGPSARRETHGSCIRLGAPSSNGGPRQTRQHPETGAPRICTRTSPSTTCTKTSAPMAPRSRPRTTSSSSTTSSSRSTRTRTSRPVNHLAVAAVLY